MKHTGKPSDQTAHPPVRERMSRLFRRAFPVFCFGWMLTYSLIFFTIVFVSMHALDLVSSALIETTGYAALTNSNFSFFLRSWQGYAVIGFLLVFLCVTGGIIINGMILLSDDMLHHRRIRILPLLKKSVCSIRLFLSRDAVRIILYYFFFVLFFTVSLLAILPNPFEIPGYIRYLLSKRLWTTALYYVVFLLICIPIFRNPLLLHDILIMQKRPQEARSRTRAFVKANRSLLFREILLSVVVFLAILISAGGIFLYAPMLMQALCRYLPLRSHRVLVLFVTYLSLAILLFAVLVSVWILPVKISLLYHYMLHGIRSLPPSGGRRCFRRSFIPFLFVVLAVICALTAVSFLQFNYLFPPARHIEAVVHRLGGDLDTENTLEGMEKALELGAPAMETDIQRTKDGEYVIFHDGTLKRMCHVPYRIHDLTLEEVRDLRLPGPDWEQRQIPLLSEVLDLGKGRVKLYLELKGKDADEQMAQDVARMVRERGMEEECVLISLNYNLISYIATQIPDLQCGYLYFFAYGSPARLYGNILMAQSNAISVQRTRSIHSKGKKVYCWTVNSRQRALDMVRQRVDGIISDRYDIIESVLDHMKSRNDYERIMDVLLR